jgi:hypothetical protein
MNSVSRPQKEMQKLHYQSIQDFKLTKLAPGHSYVPILGQIVFFWYFPTKYYFVLILFLLLHMPIAASESLNITSAACLSNTSKEN